MVWSRLPKIARATAAPFALMLALASGSLPALARGAVDSAPPPNAGAAEMASVTLDHLPREARETLELIRAGGPFPFSKDGVVFGNRERLLAPRKRGYYREYTVPTPHARNRGARRIVCGGPARTPERCFYSGDHYGSFRQIADGPSR